MRENNFGISQVSILGALLFKKVIMNHGYMAMALKPKPNQPNGRVQKSEGFAHCFFSIAMAWCIMNSCNRVVRSIRHNTLKLCVGGAKQFVKKAQNYQNTNH